MSNYPDAPAREINVQVAGTRVSATPWQIVMVIAAIGFVLVVCRGLVALLVAVTGWLFPVIGIVLAVALILAACRQHAVPTDADRGGI